MPPSCHIPQCVDSNLVPRVSGGKVYSDGRGGEGIGGVGNKWFERDSANFTLGSEIAEISKFRSIILLSPACLEQARPLLGQGEHLMSA